MEELKMRNEKKRRQQENINYAIYMIAGSYFKDAKYRSPYDATRRRLQYVEVKLDIQYTMEEKCIKYIEEELLPKLPVQIWNQSVIVEFLPRGVRFLGAKYAIDITGKAVNEKYKFNCALWRKRICSAS